MVANFRYASIEQYQAELSIAIRLSNHNMEIAALAGQDHEPGNAKSDEALSQSIEAVKFIVSATAAHFGWLKCPHIDDAARRLGYWVDSDDHKWSELNVRARALRDNIRSELKEHLFYHYPRDRGRKLAQWREDWKLVLSSFPELELEIFSATDCYALQHHTASVFHSMRVAEHGLRALTRERNIVLAKGKPVEWATWQEVIRALDEEIKRIGLMPAGGDKDATLQFYSGARADLNGFKDEYRNSVMHVRENYDEFQAVRALTKVHAFMERLASKLNSSGPAADPEV